MGGGGGSLDSFSDVGPWAGCQYGFADLEKLYPDNPFVKKQGYYLKDTKFLKDAGIELKKDLFVIMRYFDTDAEGVTEEQKAKFETEKAVMDQLIAIG